jgi:hypothetical protein
MFAGSQFYGIKRIFLNYAGLPNFFPFPYAVQHGWQATSTDFELDGKPPAILVWSKRIAGTYKQDKKDVKIITVGSFYIYVNDTENLSKGPKRGSILIVPHSSKNVKHKFSFDDLLKIILKIPEKYKPVSLLVYYLDLTPEFISFFSDFEILCNGNIDDQNFIYNFNANIDQFHTVFSDSINSATLFAGFRGLEIIFYSLQTEIVENSNIYFTDSYFEKSDKILKDLFSTFNNKLLISELGFESKLSKLEMRKLIIKGYFNTIFIKNFIYELFKNKRKNRFTDLPNP